MKGYRIEMDSIRSSVGPSFLFLSDIRDIFWILMPIHVFGIYHFISGKGEGVCVCEREREGVHRTLSVRVMALYK